MEKKKAFLEKVLNDLNFPNVKIEIKKEDQPDPDSTEEYFQIDGFWYLAPVEFLMKRVCNMATLQEVKKMLQNVVNYPEEGNPRRSEDGYPTEISYDQFAYERMVDAYRDALNGIIEKIG